MTSSADFTEGHTNSAAKHHFKSSWPEDDRPKEIYVIQTAQDRVRKWLPEQFQHLVLNRLP